MKFDSWRKIEEKVGSRGCQWSSLNGPRTKLSRCNFKVEENLMTKLDQGDDNVPVGMPHELKWQDEILKV